LSILSRLSENASLGLPQPFPTIFGRYIKEKQIMNRALFSKIFTLVMAALLATSAFAGGASHRGSLQISDPVQVNGKNLPAGDYTVTWSGDGPAVNVNFAKGGKVLATVPASLVALEQKSADNVYETKAGSTGSKELSAVRFSGQKVRLEINGGGDQSKSGDSVK
jgi:hypothetical protein